MSQERGLKKQKVKVDEKGRVHIAEGETITTHEMVEELKRQGVLSCKIDHMTTVHKISATETWLLSWHVFIDPKLSISPTGEVLRLIEITVKETGKKLSWDDKRVQRILRKLFPPSPIIFWEKVDEP